MEKRHYIGNIKKMRSRFETPIQYELPIGEELVNLSKQIGKEISLEFKGQINCVKCNRLTKKSFAQGFCYPCFMNAPESAECIIRPELCEAHLGGGRDPKWEEENHNQPHVVYLAIASGIKVGVTRATQVPFRWIDQGAWKAIKIAETDNRYQAGCIEVDLKQYASDKTPWQRMLKNELAADIDVIETKDLLLEKLDEEWHPYISDDDTIWVMNYPALRFPKTVKSHNLDKNPIFTGTLEAIKGQYLLLDGGRVINVRKYGGYNIELSIEL